MSGAAAGGIVGEQQLDLIEREPGGLAHPDDVEAIDDGVVVAALATDAGRCRDEADLLVVPQGRRGDVGARRHFADGERAHDTPDSALT